MKMDQWADIDGYRVDLAALTTLAHHCEPGLCRGGTCCAEYDVWIGDEEVSRIVGVMPAAARYARHLADLASADTLLRKLGPDAYAIGQRELGLCVFAYRAGGGGYLCSLHSAALELGLAPHRVKPDSCFLWPLAISSSRPPVVSVQEGAFAFACNTHREPDGRLDPGVAEIVRGAFGEGFLQQLARAVAA